MTETSTYSIAINSVFHSDKLQKGLWIVLVNASRIPPHVGMIFNGKYNSLNVTGQETDINVLALVKRLELQKIKSVFIKLKQHPVFSLDYLHEHFKIQVEKYEKVESGIATCFTPVRTFFTENYALHEQELEYLYHLFPALYEQEVISEAFTLNMEKTWGGHFHIKAYSMQDIDDKLNGINRK
ncbi:MAG: hypothetical protein ACJ76F_01520 [Bacteroidia bacterium]